MQALPLVQGDLAAIDAHLAVQDDGTCSDASITGSSGTEEGEWDAVAEWRQRGYAVRSPSPPSSMESGDC